MIRQNPESINTLSAALTHGHEQAKRTSGVKFYKTNQAVKEEVSTSESFSFHFAKNLPEDVPPWLRRALMTAKNGKLDNSPDVIGDWLSDFTDTFSKQGKNPLEHLIEEHNKLSMTSDHEEASRNSDGFSAEDIKHIITALALSAKFHENFVEIDWQLRQVDVSQMQTPYGFTLEQLLRILEPDALEKNSWAKNIFEQFEAQGIDPIATLKKEREYLLQNPTSSSVARSHEGFTADDLTHLIKMYELARDPNGNLDLMMKEFHQTAPPEPYQPYEGYTAKDLEHLEKGKANFFDPDGSLELARNEFGQIQSPARKYLSKRTFGLLMDVGIEVGLVKENGLIRLFWPALHEYHQHEKERRATNTKVVKQSGSKYMASTTLPDPTIENIIRGFLEDKTIRETASEVKIKNNDTISNYYDLILKRLYQIGYYKPKFFFEHKLLMHQKSQLNYINNFVSKKMKKHRGLSNDDKIQMYEAKYYTCGFYNFFLQMAFTQEHADELIGEIMFDDVRRLLRMTGQLNRPVFSMPRAEKFIADGLNRRVSASVMKELKHDSFYVDKVPSAKKSEEKSNSQNILEHISDFIGGHSDYLDFGDDDMIKAIMVMKNMIMHADRNATLWMHKPVI